MSRELLLVSSVIALACCAAAGEGDEKLGAVHRIVGDQGLKPLYYPKRGEQAAAILDLTQARFTLNNSRSANPAAKGDCDRGPLPINRQPVNLFSAPGVIMRGGVIAGLVPMGADWEYTYCNSTAVNLRNSPNATVERVRVDRGWDGIRIGANSGSFTVRDAWLSNLRDDGIENDHLYSGLVERVLIDGAMHAIALAPNRKTSVATSEDVVTIRGSLIRLVDHRVRGRQRVGTLAKSDERAPRLNIIDTIVAVDSQNGDSWPDYWANGWSKTARSQDNLFLWLSDRPIPTGFPLPREGFRVVQGKSARDIWNRARSNWINCHQELGRISGDSISQSAQCNRRGWGGVR